MKISRPCLTWLLFALGCGYTGDEGALIPVDPSLAFRPAIQTGDSRTLLFLPDYAVRVQHGSPFGIVSLRATGQQTDFAYRTLPLADWEWLRIDIEGEPKGRKLLEPDWGDPDLNLLEDVVTLRFTRQEVIRTGISLEVEFSFSINRPEFDVRYAIRNGSPQSLANPYVMIGFPGFSNHARASSVGTALGARAPTSPHTSFCAEAQEAGRDEYLLLRHDVFPQSGAVEDLKGSVSIAEAGRVFTLESSFVPDVTCSHVYSAHTNKPWYLTSHIYAFIDSIPPGGERELTIHYALWREDSSSRADAP